MPTNNLVLPTTLSGTHVSLEPLSMAHHSDLCDATRDGGLWNLEVTIIPSPEGMAAEIERRIGLKRSGSMIPFAVRHLATGKVVGMTSYMNVDAITPRVEIGSTWYARSVQRTPLNTECKLLLLSHAFETLNCIAVEFRTHSLNTPSRDAITRLGAQYDGTLRHHMRMPNGTLRDTCVYSILLEEWPSVKANCELKLSRPR